MYQDFLSPTDRLRNKSRKQQLLLFRYMKDSASVLWSAQEMLPRRFTADKEGNIANTEWKKVAQKNVEPSHNRVENEVRKLAN